MSDHARQDYPERLSEEQLNRIVEELCNSKAEEFELLGYDNVAGKEIWECVSDKYKKGLPPLYQLVNDILSLKTTHYMNWMTMNVVYKGARL